MKPPGISALRQPSPGCSLFTAASSSSFGTTATSFPSCWQSPPLLLHTLCRLRLLLLLQLLSGSFWSQPWGAAAASASYWNETAKETAGVLADEENAFQQNSSRRNNNSYSSAVQKEITLPSRLVYYINQDSESPYHVLDTKARHQQKHNKAVHLAQASFQIEAFGSRFILDLTLNNGLLSSNYVEIHYEDGKPQYSKGGEHCYYHGNIRGIKDSKAALSTCNGLHGMFEDNTFMYMIEPLELIHSTKSTGRPHIIQRTLGGHTSKQLKNLSMEEHDQWPFLSELQWLKKRRRKRRAAPRGVFEEMKYLELMIVNDHKMYKKYRSHAHTNNFAKSVVNLVDSIYKEQLNTRVVLVAVETWTEKDYIDIRSDPVQMLHEFSKYRQRIKQHADAVHLISRVIFHFKRSSLSYFGGVCSKTRGVGVNEYGLPMAVAQGLSQSLAQNLGIQWEPSSRKPKCDCTESWGGCIMEETGVSHSRKFSKCSILEYKDFLQRGGGFCLFNRPTKLFEATECGNGYVEAGEECDCGFHVECYGVCCKKCSLSNGAHCSDGPCCNSTTCLFQPRGYNCREGVNDCDITETCTGDSGQCPPNLHKQDGYSCNSNQGRCYNGECKTRDNQCQYIWGSKAAGSDKFCYEKLNTEGTEKGNCGKDGDRWIQCSKHDVFCGFLLCTNLTRVPRIGQLQGEIIPTSVYHQGRVIDCSGAHVVLDDDTDVGYVEDGTPCGPSMMCLDRKCLQIQSLNMSSCPLDSNGKVCSNHGVCSNEVTCICNNTWAGTDCSIRDLIKKPPASKDDGPKGSMATSRLIGAVAGTILALGVIFGGTGWGMENVKKRRFDPSQQGPI
ncbi:disintegrin and metalloproteinase domain-containing protein 23 isoform X2 [Antechinus flavipes]|uniref:disintegrin and metalloproteinase domain-containing protein 23 isoform X2 n=1 Tax=Antechinus flavipes TaxID=38775 RepID=UPI0022358E17|nr:disintegrin and metalloproteinase domain-containing protein 23 isoform X2 [Antechinus flavipes]